MSRHPIEVRIDVTGAADLGEACALAAWIFPADPERRAGPPTVLFCAPGGTYTKAYWHLQFPGHRGYSFAEHMLERGFSVVAWDHLAVGDSSRPTDPFRLSTGVVARANAALVEQVTASWLAGEFGAGWRPVGTPVRIGIGHSMGGMLTIRQQALARSYDAVAVCGFSTLYPMQLYGLADQTLFVGLTEDALAAARTHMPELYAVHPRDSARSLYIMDDVPADVVAADADAATNAPGLAGVACLIPGIVADDAASIDVPVFLGWGERDTSRDPHAEVSAYRNSPDVTLHILRGAAHCTNLARTRVVQWDRIAAWIDTVAAGTTGRP